MTSRKMMIDVLKGNLIISTETEWGQFRRDLIHELESPTFRPTSDNTMVWRYIRKGKWACSNCQYVENESCTDLDKRKYCPSCGYTVFGFERGTANGYENTK